MLSTEANTLKEKALGIIRQFIESNGKHGYAKIPYKECPEAYISYTYDNGIPYLQYIGKEGHINRINGDTLDNLILIADAIQEQQSLIDWVIYPQVHVRVKAKSIEEAKKKCTDYLMNKGIEENYILISNKDCHKV